MSFDFVSLVRAGDDPMAQVVISKADPNIEKDAMDKCATCGSMAHKTEDHMTDKIKKADLPAEAVEYIEALEADNDELSKALEDAQAEFVLKSAENIEKSDEATLLEKADPAIKALFQAQAARIEKADAIAKAERDARLEREYIAKAEKLPMIGDDKAGLAGLLRRAAEVLTPEDNASLAKMLDSANAQLAKGGLFAEFGKSGAETTISKSITAAAEEIRKREPELTIEQATVKAYTENPSLFAEAMSTKE